MATDALIAKLITNASAFMTRYMNRNIFQATYNETRNGSGNWMLSLANFPIVSVSSLVLDGRTVNASLSTANVGYTFDKNLLYYRWGIFCAGVQNVTVTYVAGIASYTGSPAVPVDIPPDLAQVCIDLVTVKYKRRLKLDVQGETLAQQTVTFVTGDLTQGARLALDQWRDMRPIE